MSDGGGNGLHDFEKDGDLFIRVPGSKGKVVLRYEKSDDDVYNAANEPLDKDEVPQVFFSLRIWDGNTREELRKILVVLVNNEQDVKRVLDDCEIKHWRINLSASLNNIWHAIIVEAKNDNKIHNLIDWAIREYPENEELQDFVSRKISFRRPNNT